MKKTTLLAAAATLALCAGAAAKADPYEPYGSNPNHYYSQNDHNGYYDRNGNYHRFDRDNDDRYGPPPPNDGPGYQPSYYYNDGDESCYRANQNNKADG